MTMGRSILKNVKKGGEEKGELTAVCKLFAQQQHAPQQHNITHHTTHHITDHITMHTRDYICYKLQALLFVAISCWTCSWAGIGSKPTSTLQMLPTPYLLLSSSTSRENELPLEENYTYFYVVPRYIGSKPAAITLILELHHHLLGPMTLVYHAIRVHFFLSCSRTEA